MFANEQESSTKATRPPRMIKLSYAAWMAVVLLVVVLAVWAWKSVECTSIARDRDAALRAASEQSAQSIAKSIATFANRLIVGRNNKELQEYADSLVRGTSIAYVAITDARNRAIVHTNREFLGKALEEPDTSSDVVEASVDVMNLTARVGTVRVGLRVK